MVVNHFALSSSPLHMLELQSFLCVPFPLCSRCNTVSAFRRRNALSKSGDLVKGSAILFELFISPSVIVSF